MEGMELRHLRYFLAIVSAKSFTRAADQLGIAQPTLSQQIRQLEEIAGAPLFDRLGRRVALTSTGEALVPHAQDTLRAADAAVQSFNESTDLLSGRMSLASFPSLSPFMLPAMVKFFNRFPKIHITHQELTTFDLYKAIQNGEAELGFGVNSAIPNGITAQELFKEDLVLAFGATNPLSQQTVITAKDLDGPAFVEFGYERLTHNSINKFFERNALAPHYGMKAPSISALLQVLTQTDMVGLVPESYSTMQNESLRFQELDRPPSRNIAMLYLAKATASAASREFRKTVVSEAKRLKVAKG
ncbi:MAG: LysR substrate-binding domain-containing protein [Pseudomonadota bacterium]